MVAVGGVGRGSKASYVAVVVVGGVDRGSEACGVSCCSSASSPVARHSLSLFVAPRSASAEAGMSLLGSRGVFDVRISNLNFRNQ